MATNPEIENIDRVIDASPVSPTTDFVIDWPVYFTDGEDPAADLLVFVDGSLLTVGDFSFTGNPISGLSGAYNGGTVSLDNSASGSRVIIASKRDPRRIGYYLEGKSLPFTELDKLMNDFAVQMRDLALGVSRSLKMSLPYYLDGQASELSASPAQIEAAAAMASTGLIPGTLGALPTTSALMGLFGVSTVLAGGTSFVCLGRDVVGDGGGGSFYYDSGDTSTADNGGTVRVDAQGRRFKLSSISGAPTTRQFGCKHDGVTNDRAALLAASAWCGAKGIDLIVSAGVCKVNSNVTLPSGLAFERGGVLKPANGVTIQTNGRIKSESVQIFDITLGGVIAGSPILEEFWVEWFGTKGTGQPADGDDAIPLNAAFQWGQNANPMGATTIGHARPVCRFACRNYLVKTTVLLPPFINYEGVRSSQYVALADYSDLQLFTGTSIRADTSLYTAANQGVVAWLPVGDAMFTGINFIGTSNFSANPSCPLQIGCRTNPETLDFGPGSNSVGRAASVCSGLVFNNCSFVAGTINLSANWLNDAYFHECRFEGGVRGIYFQLAANNSLGLSDCVFYAVSLAHIDFQTGVGVDLRASDTVFQTVINGETVILCSDGIAVNVSFLFSACRIERAAGTSQYAIDWRASGDIGNKHRMKFTGCQVEGLAVKLWKSSTGNSGSEFGQIDFVGSQINGSAITISEKAYVGFVGCGFDNSSIDFSAGSAGSGNGHRIVGNSFRNLSGTAITFCPVFVGGVIEGNTFQGVTTPLGAFQSGMAQCHIAGNTNYSGADPDTVMQTLPTSAPSQSGAIWVDTGAANVLKRVT